jgi:hypothetical protein
MGSRAPNRAGRTQACRITESALSMTSPVHGCAAKPDDLRRREPAKRNTCLRSGSKRERSTGTMRPACDRGPMARSRPRPGGSGCEALPCGILVIGSRAPPGAPLRIFATADDLPASRVGPCPVSGSLSAPDRSVGVARAGNRPRAWWTPDPQDRALLHRSVSSGRRPWRAGMPDLRSVFRTNQVLNRLMFSRPRDRAAAGLGFIRHEIERARGRRRLPPAQ